MRKLALAVIIALTLLFSLTLFISAQEPNKNSDPLSTPTPVSTIDPTLLPKIEPQLLKKLLTEDDAVSFIVYLKENTDIDTAVNSVPALNAQGQPDPVIKRAAIIDALQQTAQESQSGVLAQLNQPSGISGQAATNIQPLWIVNAVAAKGTLQTVLELAARPDVAIVRLDKTVHLNHPAPSSSAFIPNLLGPHPSSFEWGITKIRADLVHSALNITGSGTVVANIDSGVDWYHPALQSKYRGYNSGKLPLHIGNWHDTTGMGAVYPTDGDGHGTHTMGTMVGDNGVGVAPGAQWIAVRAFNNNTAQSSWLHLAFEWILAPNHNPALAPDIVNNSWGSSNGYSTEFQPDIQALLAAGIYPVFSAGNSGPYAGTVGSPGSLDITFAVGATTIDDEIASFSSRGPSPWGKIKPEVSAPGKNVRSTLPGGAYGSYNGTSMAAPHVSGLAALLLQASPTLANNLADISAVITSTAVQLGNPIPNNNYGWGRIDAYNAVLSVSSAGALQGTVTGDGTAIDNATVSIAPRSGGPAINTQTDAAGAYHQGLTANTYDVTASAFGHAPATVYNLVITNGQTLIQDFNLTPYAEGVFSGTVKESGTNKPLSATLNINNTPLTTTTNPADGSFNLMLPVGTYTATVMASAHRITQAVNIVINETLPAERHFLLDPAPTILLVDSGRWYQESEIGFYQQALHDALYTYDMWEITRPFDTPNDVPISTTLMLYDIVIWSSPEDSPGYVGANDALEGFLDDGGKLLISGQDVAYYDGGGAFFVQEAPYLEDYLKTDYIKDDAEEETVTGIQGEPFAGLSLTISQGDGANNQRYPDVIANADADFAVPAFTYPQDQLAALHVGRCVPYRAMLLAFGFEAINTRTDRQTVMERTIDWLMQSPAPYDFELTLASATEIGNFDTTISHTLRLRNTGSQNDTYTLTIGNGAPYNWPVSPNSLSPITLDSCQAQAITLTVNIPASYVWHISDTFTVTGVSTQDPAHTERVTRTTKTPAPVLLVDDDRWYSFADEYKAALEANNIPYDYWYVPKSWRGPVPPSPPTDTLKIYPMVVWYTAYDWYQPLTPTEEDRLAAYLDSGGRLFFSSQDYIYNLPDGKPGPFAQDYLGVLDHTEDYTSTLIVGRDNNPVGHGLGPYALTFPSGYRNWTDALTPTTEALTATAGQEDQTNSVTLAGTGPAGNYWHTNFFAYGPELLADSPRARLIQRSLGWLSWLGRSTTTSELSKNGNDITGVFTATVTNDGWINLPTAHFTATFPTEMEITGYGPKLTPSGDDLIWSGPLDKDQQKIFTYTVNITNTLPSGTKLSQTNWLAYPEHNIVFDQITDVRVNVPNLEASTMAVMPTQDVAKDDVLTYTIVLKNNGMVDTPLATTTNTLPDMLVLTGIDSLSRGSIMSSSNRITWTTPLSKNEAVTLTYRAIISYQSHGSINNTAYVNDGFDTSLKLTAQTSFKTGSTYLPIVFKE